MAERTETAMSVVAKAIVDDAWRAGFETARAAAIAETEMELRITEEEGGPDLCDLIDRLRGLKAEVPQ